LWLLPADGSRRTRFAGVPFRRTRNEGRLERAREKGKVEDVIGNGSKPKECPDRGRGAPSEPSPPPRGQTWSHVTGSCLASSRPSTTRRGGGLLRRLL